MLLYYESLIQKAQQTMIFDNKFIKEYEKFYLVELHCHNLALYNTPDRGSKIIRGIFDKNGDEIIIQKNILDNIEIKNDNNFYEFHYQDGFYLVTHYKYSTMKNKFMPKEIKCSQNKPIMAPRLCYNFGSLPEEFTVLQLYRPYQSEMVDDGYLLYSQSHMKPLFTCSEVTTNYNDYPSIPKVDYLLVTKIIELDNNTAKLQFFIDKSGNIVSHIFDYQRGTFYTINGLLNNYSSLEEVCRAVRELLRLENKEASNKERELNIRRKQFKNSKLI